MIRLAALLIVCMVPSVSMARGPALLVSEFITLHDPARQKDLPVAANFPSEGGPFPVIVFSHGAGGSGENYLPIIEYRASHGYVVLAPTHAESIKLRHENGEEMGSLKEAMRDTLLKIATDFEGWENRAKDVSMVISSFDEIEHLIPELKGRMDRQRVGVGGHSYGAFTSALIGGATIRIPAREAAASFEDSRAGLILIMSGVGKSPVKLAGFQADSWATIERPMMVMTGSKDQGITQHQTPKWRLDPYELAAAGDKYSVFIDGATHMSFSGRDSGKNQAKIMKWIQEATLNFWDAYLKDSDAAKENLKTKRLEQTSGGAVELRTK